MERIFGGAGWAYVGLEIEIPNPGDFKVTRVGDRSVVITRDETRRDPRLRQSLRASRREVVPARVRQHALLRLPVPPVVVRRDRRVARRAVHQRRESARRHAGRLRARRLRVCRGSPSLHAQRRDLRVVSPRAAGARDVSRRDEHALLRPGVRRPRTETARLFAPADSRQLEADVREHQRSVSRVAAARFPGDVRTVPRRSEVAGAHGPDAVGTRC